MGKLGPAHFDDEVTEAPLEVETPQVFVRAFSTASGMPWDQTRAAQLEARHGSPLPIVELDYRLKRLESWGPGKAGRFAVFYVRRKDYTTPFETTLDVDGQAVRVAFGSAVGQLKRVRGLVLTGLCVAVFAVLFASAVARVVSAREQADQRLDVLERETTAKLHFVRKLQSERDQNRELVRSQGASGTPADVLSDLNWLLRVKTADARIVAVHWDHGLLAVESRGQGAPLVASDRQIVRSKQPVRSGVWLWGVDRPQAGATGQNSNQSVNP